jgi:hypothetical protein
MDDPALRLCRDAHELCGCLLVAMWHCEDDDRLDRLKALHHRAERRYWRRREAAFPPGNRTPDWFYRSAKGGY